MNKENDFATIEDCVNVSYEKMTPENRKFRKICITATILLLVGIAVFLVYITRPRNKALMHKLFADTYYANGKFDDARVEYEKAVSIDESVLGAHKGLLLCDFALGNNLLKDDFSKAGKAFSDVYKSGKVPENYETILCETYLFAPEIYTTDSEKLIEVLSEGCNNMPQNTGLNAALSDAYYLNAERCVESGNYSRAAECYTMVDLLRNTSDCFEKAKDAAACEIYSLMTKNLYEEAYNYAASNEKYFRDEIDEWLRAIAYNGLSYESGKAAMGKAYEALNDVYVKYSESLDYSTNKDINTADVRLMSENLDAMLMIDGSTDADLCAYSFLKEKYLMTPQGDALGEDYSGVGIGIYTYGDKAIGINGKETISYYFFIGNYVNGKREGYGISYALVSQTSYAMFEGYYKNDVPNGFGILYLNERFDYTSISKAKTTMAGVLKDGRFDGKVQVAAWLNDFPDDDFNTEFTAKEGVPNTIPDETLFYSVMRSPDNDMPLYAVLVSSLYGYASYLPLYYDADNKLGALGYDF